MNQVLEFGKQNAKWIVAGLAAVAATVVGVVVYTKMGDEDGECIIVEDDVSESQEED